MMKSNAMIRHQHGLVAFLLALVTAACASAPPAATPATPAGPPFEQTAGLILRLEPLPGPAAAPPAPPGRPRQDACPAPPAAATR